MVFSCLFCCFCWSQSARRGEESTWPRSGRKMSAKLPGPPAQSENGPNTFPESLESLGLTYQFRQTKMVKLCQNHSKSIGRWGLKFSISTFGPRIPSDDFLLSEVRPACVQGLAQRLGQEIDHRSQTWGFGDQFDLKLVKIRLGQFHPFGADWDCTVHVLSHHIPTTWNREFPFPYSL